MNYSSQKHYSAVLNSSGPPAFSASGLSNYSSQHYLNSSTGSKQEVSKHLAPQTQERSVERLKTCIADLKKLATNNHKPSKRQGYGQASNMPSEVSFNGNTATGSGVLSAQNQEERSNRSRRDSKRPAGQEKRSTHQTKITNALKKYIPDFEYQTSSGYNHVANQRAARFNDSGKYENKENKPRTRAASAKRPSSSGSYKNSVQKAPDSGRRSQSKTNLNKQQSKLDNSLKDYQKYRKAASQNRFSQYNSSGRLAAKGSNSVGRQDKSSIHSSSSHKRQDSSQKNNYSNYSKVASHKDRKPITYSNNYVESSKPLREIPSVQSSEPSQGVDIRVKNYNGSGPVDYHVISSPPEPIEKKQSYYGGSQKLGPGLSNVILPEGVDTASQGRTSQERLHNHHADSNKSMSSYLRAINSDINVPRKSHQEEDKRSSHISGVRSVERETTKTSKTQLHPQPLEQVRSIQEHGQMTQSTDFSDNRIRSLEGKKQQQQQQQSIYSLQYQSTQHCTAGVGQQTASSLAYAREMSATKGSPDFNIEDIHMQIVQKQQRGQKLICEIEGDESEELFFRGTRQQTVKEYKDHINLGSDGCTKPAIRFNFSVRPKVDRKRQSSKGKGI